jgi:U6 snRNA phosphodiesterase
MTNDERTRTFLTMEVGAGHDKVRLTLSCASLHTERSVSSDGYFKLQLQDLAHLLAPTLRAIRQQEFFVEPRFHASIGWALLDHDRSVERTAASTSTPTCHPPSENCTPRSFPTIPHFPPSLISTLNDKYGERLASVGALDVKEVYAKIGKEIHKWRLTR